MTLQWFDAMGLCGVALVLLAYLGLQARHLKGDGWGYPSLNLLGSLAILASLLYDETLNASAFVMQIAWIAISLYGLYRFFAARRSAVQTAD